MSHPRAPRWTTSKLKRFCAYPNVLDGKRTKSAYVQGTAVEGTRFGKYVEDWLTGKNPQPPEVVDDPWRWFEYMRQTWRPPVGAKVRCEMPLGLASDGHYEEVVEVEPHVYVPTDPEARVVTAGRADLIWLDGAAVVVGDLKRSAWRYGEPSKHPQLMALGVAAADAFGRDWMRLGLYDARDGVWTWDEPLRPADVLDEVLEMAALPETPVPGWWCGTHYECKSCEHFQKEGEQR